LDALLVLADRQRWIPAVSIFTTGNALLALADGQRGVLAVGAGGALDALAVATNRRRSAAVLVREARHAIAGGEITQGGLGLAAVRVGAACKMALAIDATSPRRGAIGVDQTLMAFAVVQVADRVHGSAISARRAL